MTRKQDETCICPLSPCGPCARAILAENDSKRLIENDSKRLSFCGNKIPDPRENGLEISCLRPAGHEKSHRAGASSWNFFPIPGAPWARPETGLRTERAAPTCNVCGRPVGGLQETCAACRKADLENLGSECDFDEGDYFHPLGGPDCPAPAAGWDFCPKCGIKL